MSGNAILGKSKKAREDECYTRREDIEQELAFYTCCFVGKVVYCNCDDPKQSEFWKFFARNFKPFGLKGLISTHFEPNEKNHAYKLVVDDGDAKPEEVVEQPIMCNGDFRSQVCVDLLKEADIVVTNPPFSLFREYVGQLMEHEKKFLIIAPLTGVKYKETFPFLRDGKMWLGYTHPKKFVVPEGTTGKSVSRGSDGLLYKSFGNICWVTNLDIEKRHEFLDLRGTYLADGDYPEYTNFDGIDVANVNNIPCDFPGNMGVPISALDRICTDQFEIVGLGEGDLAKEIGVGKNHRGRTDLEVRNADGSYRRPFARIVIRNRHPEPEGGTR